MITPTTLVCSNCGCHFSDPIIILIDTSTTESICFCSLECVRKWIDGKLGKEVVDDTSS